VAVGKAAQRGLGGGLGVGDVAGWAQPGEGRDQRGRGQGAQLLAQLGWGGDQQRLELVGGLAAGLDRATTSDAQRADRLDTTIAALGCGGGRAASAARAAQ